ncbi:MAG: saccharopine dehydrogenase NADP-binding domain-containing protein, partial [Nanoarchaeota archaeon]|nr:saccharopine dehydrogenase NADP-binding domain-containing protein [Nanoarchaeota archaeon]
MAKYLVIGTGLQGTAIAGHLLQSENINKVGVLDSNWKKAADLRDKLNDSRVEAIYADATDYKQMQAAMSEFDVAIGAASYKLNYELTKTAINQGVHFCDLGGNNAIVDKQFSLNEKAKAKGVKIIPDQGVAPGAVSILAADGWEEIKKNFNSDYYPDYIYQRVGGLDLYPRGFLKYGIVFSATGLINEYREDTEIVKKGKKVLVDSLTEIEKIEFPEPFGVMEAAYTSGGSSTLTRTLEGIVKEINYKTIRYPEHFGFMRMMLEKGFFEYEKISDNGIIIPKEVVNARLSQEEITKYNQALNELGLLNSKNLNLQKDLTIRGLTEYIFNTNLPKVEKDVILLKVIVGKNPDENFKGMEVEYTLIDYFNKDTGHTAMQRTTGYSASIVAQMMGNNVIKDNGIL